MGIIKSEQCPICEKSTNVFEKVIAKYNGQHICKNCAEQISAAHILLTNIAQKSIEELRSICCNNNSKVNQIKKGDIVMPNYVVLQVVLKEKFIGTGSANLTELEEIINKQASKGYKLHTISTTSSGSKGLMRGDRIQATLVFEKI